MKKTLYSVLLLLLSLTQLAAQTKTDTANFPYWVTMMQDPSVNFYKTQRAFNLYWENRPITPGCGWKAFKRWEWIAERTIDSLGNFPNDSLQMANYWQLLKANGFGNTLVLPGLGSGSVSCKTQGDWSEVGPIQLPYNNTGQMNGMGRLNSVAIHPTDSNFILCGGASGGIWKSTDGGMNWNVYKDSMPTQGVSAIAFHPNFPDTIYMGTGDRDAGDAPGFGVWRSSDKGATWRQFSTGLGNRVVGKIVVSKEKPHILIAATNNGIYRSTNSGNNWTQVLTGGHFKDLEFKPNNNRIVYATRDGMFFRSTDFGVNWSQITTGLPTTSISRFTIDASPLMPNLVYVWGANGSVNRGFYLSRDSGTSFSTQSTTPNIHDYSTTGSGSGGQAWYNKDMVVDPNNPAIVYCGGVNVFKSTDTGRTWSLAGYWVTAIHADQHELIADPLTKRVYAANDGGLYYTRNQGASWIPIKSGLGIAQIYKMDASRSQPNILINGYQDNGTANLYQGSWYTTRGGDGMDCEIDQTDNNYSYGELYYGSIFRIYGVNTQATIAENGINGINESGGWVTPFTLREGTGNTMYVGYKNIWRSTNIRNNPPTWTRISNNLGGTNSVNFTEIESCIANSDILYASRNGSLFRSDDVNAATPSWNTLTQPASGTIFAIETDPKNQNIVYVNVGPRVYRSTNRGNTWTQVAGTLSHNVNCILLDTSSSKKGLYVGTNGGGVWYTDTTLSSWRYYNKNLPTAMRVTDLKIYYDKSTQCKNSILYASTYNRGNWQSPLYNDGTEKPIARRLTADSVVCVQAVAKLSADVCNLPGRVKWQIDAPSYQFVNSTDSMSEIAYVKFNTTGVFRYKFMAENCQGIDTIESYITVGDTVKPAACKPTATGSSANRGIFAVELRGVKHLSKGIIPEGGYNDFACTKVFKVQRGKKYALKVTTGISSTDQVKAFIDFNDNQTLNDAGELCYSPAAAVQNHIDTITIPTTAVINKILRFRIKSDGGSVSTNPCQNVSLGQIEDYGIIVIDSVFPKFKQSKKLVCAKEEIEFTDTTKELAVNYLWDFGTGATPATSNTKGPHKVTYSTPGFKKVKLTIDGFSIIKDSVVEVMQSPNLGIEITKGKTNNCENEELELKITDTANVYQLGNWYKNNVKINDSTFSLLRIKSLKMNDSATYKFIALNGICKDSAEKNILVHYKPTIKFTINDSTQCLDYNHVTFTSNSNVINSSLTHNWKFDDGLTASGNITNRNYITTGTQKVKLISISAFSCQDSLEKEVQIYPNSAPSFTVDSKDTQCFRYNSFSFTNTTALGSGTFNSSWNFGDASQSTTTDPKNKRYSVYNNSYFVQLITTTDKGCKDTFEKNIYLQSHTNSNFTINNNLQCFKNNSFDFVNTTNANGNSFTNEWLLGDNTTASTIQISNKNYATFTDSTLVKLITTTAFGCKDTVGKKIYLVHSPVANFSINDSTQCLRWNQFKFTNTTILNKGNIIYKWNMGNSNSYNSINAQESYVMPGNYFVELLAIANGNCRDSIKKQVQIFHQTNINFVINNSVQCSKNNNFSITENGNINSGSYTSSWNLGDGNTSTGKIVNHSYANAGNFTIQLITNTNNNCKDTLPKIVTINASPKVKFSINDSQQCLQGNNFLLTDLTGAPSTATRNWVELPSRNNIGNTSTLNHNRMSIGNFSYLLTIKTLEGCEDSLIKTIQVDPNPVFTIDGDKEYCLGETVTLTATSTDPGLTYSWKINNIQSFIGNPFISTPLNAGSRNVEVVATNAAGCKTTQTETNRFTIYNLPVPQIDTNLIVTSAGVQIEFNDFTPGNIVQRTWISSPLTSASNSSGQYILNSADSVTLNIKLNVEDDNGCVGVLNKKYFISIPNQFYFPNSFTPNGDGLNDVFGIVGFNKTISYELQIFDRWGKKVFQSKSSQLAWDGKYDGKVVNNGIYIYKVYILDLNHKRQIKSGVVNVIR